MKQVKVLLKTPRTIVVFGREPKGDGHYSGESFTLNGGQISAIGENTFKEMKKSDNVILVDAKMEKELLDFCKEHSCNPSEAHTLLYVMGMKKASKPKKASSSKEVKKK